MTTSSITTSPLPSHHPKRPLLLAAYRYGDPFRKRRVKVPSNIPWNEFLLLFYSRLEISRDWDIEIFDESGIEIVSVDDLVDNDVLVVREKRPSNSKTEWSPLGNTQVNKDPPTNEPFRRSRDQPPPNHMTSNASNTRMHGMGDHTPSPLIVGVPHLTHFIQCNSFGYYFLAETDNVKVVPSSQGRIKRAHCIVKVPHIKDSLRTLDNEATLLRRIAYHKSIITPPYIHIINFSDDKIQRFFYSVPAPKQGLLHTLFTVGGTMQAYVYPLYGVTMATKIKGSLYPERVLKYVYQLVDIMYYLQQRGIIHQNLLPENIQVMSNDRVIVCNFETAIQTDPNTCFMVVSGGVAAPSNRAGLSPEVISAFARLRIESETMDYSTQYPWMFGVLSILIATGIHPLIDYPTKYEEGYKIRYRTHHLQSLPDPDKYPPVFIKLVKRSMSCDAVRRPTLLQILTILKRDPKILSLMTGNRLPVDRGGRHDNSSGLIPPTSQQASKDTGFKGIAQLPSQSSIRRFYDIHPPPPPSSVGGNNYNPLSPRSVTSSYEHCDRLIQSREYPSGNVYARSHDQRRGSHDSHVTQDSSMDPFLPLNNHKGLHQPPDSTHKEVWYTFGDNSPTTGKSLGVTTPTEMSARQPLKRYGSSGAFSDDFILTPGSRDRTASSSLTPSSNIQRGSPTSRLTASSEQLLDYRHGDKRQLGRSADLLHTLRTSSMNTNSEGDLTNLQEFQYQRLFHSPNTTWSSQESPVRRKSEDMEHLITPSSPETEVTTGDIIQKNTELGNHGANEQKVRAVKKPENSQKEWRSLTGSRKGSTLQSQATRTVLSDGDKQTSKDTNSSSLGHLGDFSSDILQHFSSLGDIWSSNNTAVERSGHQSHDRHVRTGSSSSTTGVEGCLLSSTKQTAQSLDLTGPSLGGVANSEGVTNRETREASMEISLSPGGRSPDHVRSTLPREANGIASDKSTSIGLDSGCGERRGYLTSMQDLIISPSPPPENINLDVFPRALDSESNLLDGLQMGEQDANYKAPPIIANEEERTHRGSHERDSSSMHVSDWVQEVTRAVNKVGTTSHVTSHVTTTIQDVSTSSYPADVTVPRNYDLMSPIPEASQELTNSMSQPTTGSHHVRAISSISENSSNSNRASPSMRQHDSGRPGGEELGSSDATLLNQSNISEQGVVLPQGKDASKKKHTPKHSETIMTDKSGGSGVGGGGAATGGSGAATGGGGGGGGSTDNSVVQTPPHRHNPLNSNDQDGRGNSWIPGQPTQHPSTSRDLQGEHPRVHRSSTPHSISSSPPRSIGMSRDNPRPLSPLATTTLTASNFTMPTVEPRPSQEGDGDSQWNLSASQNSNIAVSQSGGNVSSKMRYSQQRQDNFRSQQRISQDLEMMNLAISGMDSQISSSHPSSSDVAVAHSQASSVLEEHHQRGTRIHRNGQPHHQQNSIPSPPHTSTSRAGRHHTEGSVRSSQQNSTSISHSSAIFRPITPTTNLSNRSASAPGRNGIENLPHPPVPSSTPNPVHTTRSNQRPSDPRQFSHSAGHSYGTGTHHNRQQQQQQQHVVNSRDTRQLSSSAGHQGMSPPHPPQVAADSYDYLPPYSPPVSGPGRSQQQVVSNRTQQHNHQQQQQHHHQQQGEVSREEEGSFADPPPSYNEIFGGSQTSGGQEIRRRHRHSRSQGRNQSSQSSQSDGRHFSRQSSNTGRLSTITNLFRRSRKNSRSEDHNTLPQVGGVADDYTAQWVASYSHTPRPHNAVDMGQINPLSSQTRVPTDVGIPSHSLRSGHEQPLSHVTGGSHPPMPSPPVPYRHPPPFPSSENIHQTTTTTSSSGGVSGITRGSLGNLDQAHARAPQGIRSRNNHGNDVQGAWQSRDRPRPVSAHLPSEMRVNGSMQHAVVGNTHLAQGQMQPVGSTHSSLNQRTYQGENMSASCTNISSTNNERRPRSRSSFRRRGVPPPIQPREPDYRANTERSSLNHASSGNRVNVLGATEGHGSQSGSVDVVMRGEEEEGHLISNANSNNINTSSSLANHRADSSNSPSPVQVITSVGAHPVSNESGRVNINPATTVGSQSMSNESSRVNINPVTTVGSQSMSNESSRVNVSHVTTVGSQSMSNESSRVNVNHVTTVGSQSVSNASSHVNINHVTTVGSQSVSNASSRNPVTTVGSQSVSNASSHVNVNASSASSQVVAESVGSNHISPNIQSNSTSHSGSTRVNSSSSRSAARHRAERRRSYIISTRSSSEEDIVSDLSQASHSRARPRRRRSQGSGILVGGSQESSALFEGVVGGEEEEEERSSQQAVCSVEGNNTQEFQDDVNLSHPVGKFKGGVVHSQHRGWSQSEVVTEGGNSQVLNQHENDGPEQLLGEGRLESHRSSEGYRGERNQSEQVCSEDAEHIVEVVIDTTTTPPPQDRADKSCGHSCKGPAGEIICCSCKRDRARTPSSTSDYSVEECQLCTRRRDLADHSTVGCLGNIKVPDPTRHPENIQTWHQQSRGNKNCVVM